MAKRDRSVRKERIPVGVARPRLESNEEVGFKNRWVNDTDNRIQMFLDGGYEFCTEKNVDYDHRVSKQEGMGTAPSKVVGTHKDGTPQKAYLMRIRKEWYDEDQAQKFKDIDENEKAIKRGADSQGSPGDGKRYVPSSGITIDHGRGG